MKAMKAMKATMVAIAMKAAPQTTRMLARKPSPLRWAGRGFTLVEVLVALFAMAVLAALAWRGMDSMLRTREITSAALERSQRLATVLTQWEQDLSAVVDTLVVPPLAFDGRSLRLTRRVEGGVALVVWALRSGKWQRWAGTPVVRVVDLQEAWIASQSLLGNEPGQVLAMADVQEWQIYFHRGGAWSNAQSSGDLAQATAPAAAAATPPGQSATPAEGSSAVAPGGAAPSAGANPAGGAAPAAPAVGPLRELLPAAVRLVIKQGERSLTRDLAMGPAGAS